MTEAIIEFVGGPWDSQRKALKSTPRELKIAVYTPPAYAMVPGDEPLPSFPLDLRVGIYRLGRFRREAAYIWDGERTER